MNVGLATRSALRRCFGKTAVSAPPCVSGGWYQHSLPALSKLIRHSFNRVSALRVYSGGPWITARHNISRQTSWRVSPGQMRKLATKPSRIDKRGPVSWLSFAFVVLAGGAVLLYVRAIKKEKEELVEKKKTQSLGKAALGGPYSLIDHNGEPKTEQDFIGQWVLLYFGFTFCPDICPDELEKLATIVDTIDATPSLPAIQPIFITVDPDRDTPKVIKEYLKEFHPRLLGLTGSKEALHEAAKAYRVYYSVGPSDSDNDYLVDHTIIMYLVGPDGKFVDYFGQNRKAEEMTATVANHMLKFKVKRQ